MLILDTCVLTRQRWDSPIWETLYALKESGSQRLAIPEVVLMELLAQREREYQSALSKAKEAYDALWALDLSSDDGAAHWPAVYAPDGHVRLWENIYRRTFDVLPLTLEAAREGMRREAFRILPAKPAGKAAGSRDSAIWMTVLEHAKTAPEKEVYFVSSNSNDFGKDGKLFESLAAEAASAGVSVKYLSDLKDVIGRFARKIELPHDDADLTSRLSDPSTRGWMHQYVVSQIVHGQFQGHVVDFDDHEAPFSEWRDFDQLLSTPAVRILSWTDAARYEMGSDSTTAATVRIAVGGVARRLDFMQTQEIFAFTLDIRLLFGAGSLTALSTSASHPFTEEEENSQALNLVWKMMDEIRGTVDHSLIAPLTRGL